MKASIIVPTYNERENLKILVERIANSLKEREYEIIVVDDNSPDGTWKLAQDLAQFYPIRLIKR
ncbi:MAG: glycosyltransferase, partial [Candidatus Bathyarchaeia archaeon]